MIKFKLMEKTKLCKYLRNLIKTLINENEIKNSAQSSYYYDIICIYRVALH